MGRASSKLLQAAAGNAGGDPVYVDDVFSTYLYTGTGSSLAINNGIDLSGEGGMVWFAKRDSGDNHFMSDTVRGATKTLRSNTTREETTDTGAVTSFTSSGFALGGDGSVNGSTGTFVAWTFRKQPGFFDVVTYTGNGGTSQTINHNLGSVPGMIIVKATSSGKNWEVFHRSTGSTKALYLNETSAANTGTGHWNDTDPTSTDFTVGSYSNVNGSGITYVAYLFAHDAQDFGKDSDEAIIKCGSFTGNPSTINLGFEPQWMIAKKYNTSSPWQMFDTMRGWTADGGTKDLEADTASAETDRTSQNYTQLKSTGVTFNSYGGSWIYMAIARSHKPASEFAATNLFALDTEGSAGSLPGYRSNSPVDMALRPETGGGSFSAVARLTQGKQLYTNGTNAETSATLSAFDYQNGFSDNAGVSSNRLGFMFTRAKGYFDVVAYAGNSTAGRTVAHNLNAVPEMMLVKRRSAASTWMVYINSLGPTYYTKLESGASSTTDANERWNNTSPTASVFTLGTKDEVNQTNHNYIAYLFASVAGISKVGSYTGTGNDLNVDCGFSAGARFVLIKRTDSTGDWYLWDSVRGIVAGNDSYLLLNSTAAQVTNTDYIDPLSSGFTITSSAPAALNNNGGNYIFLAIA